jgi:hypothetical protein
MTIHDRHVMLLACVACRLGVGVVSSAVARQQARPQRATYYQPDFMSGVKYGHANF